MSNYNADFWEIQIEAKYLENVPANQALWFETDEDREHRYALQDFFQAVKPVVADLIDNTLTKRQREVITLYYIQGRTQEDIALILDVSQSTVSRHLFGTARGGKKVGGALSKLRKIVEKRPDPVIATALDTLQSSFARAF